MRRGFLALPFLATSIAVASGSGAAAEPPPEVTVHACEEGAPEGWEVLEESSGASETSVLCNFLVSRFHEEIGQTLVSGIAITVEYFCTAAEGQESFAGKTGSRDTETFRSATKVVTEEGPAATNKDNPQTDPITGFGPEPYFLQEKAWELISPQVVATIVVLTNERGPVSEAERFGITIAEPPTIVIANNHRPTTCNVPAIGGAPGGLGPSGGGGAGGPGRIIIATGVGGLITIGGVTIWRRRRNRPFNRPPSGLPAHPRCLGQSQAYEQSREVLQTLREAFQDLSEELLAAQKNHQNNIVKTHMLIGFEAGQIVGSTIDDLAMLTRKPFAHVGRAPADNWKPPGGLDAKMAAALRSAMDVLERARGRVGDLRNQLSSIGASLKNLATHPMVQEAQARATAALNAVRRGEQALAASSAARSAIDALDDNISRVGTAARSNFDRVDGLENNISRFRGWIAAAEDEIVKMTQTVDGANPLQPPVASAALTSKQASLESMKRQLGRDLAELAPLKANHQDTLKNMDTLMNRRDQAMQELARHGDVMAKDVEQLRNVHQQLTTEATAVGSRVAGEIGNRHEAVRARLIAAETEESLAAAYMKGLRAQLDRAGTAVSGVGRRVLEGATSVLTLPLVPVTWLWEKGFGTTQSVPEAFEILVRGEQRLTEMTRNLTKVERAIETTRRQTEQHRTALQTCLDALDQGAVPMASVP